MTSHKIFCLGRTAVVSQDSKRSIQVAFQLVLCHPPHHFYFKLEFVRREIKIHDYLIKTRFMLEVPLGLASRLSHPKSGF